MSSSIARVGARRLLATAASSATVMPRASTSTLSTRAAMSCQRWNSSSSTMSTFSSSLASRATSGAAQFMEEQGVPVSSHLNVMDGLLDGGGASDSATGGLSATSETVVERAGYAPSEIPPRKDPVLELFTNLLMVHGRKAEAERRMSEVLRLLRTSTHKDPVSLIHSAVELASPTIRMTTLRRASKNVPLPSALDARQRARQGIMWILKAAERGRGGGLTPRSLRIAKEVVAVLDGSSSALQRKEEVHRLGAVNRSNLATRL